MGNEAVEKVLEEHLFTVDRGIDDYSSFLGPEFRDSLAKLSSSGHWIDMGAGLGHAQIEYGNLFSQNAPQMTAITYKGDAPAAPTPTFKMLSGRRFESIPDEELELADVITDIVGVLNYTSTLDLVFKRYISLLKPGGKIFIFLPSPITWILTGDERISLFEWLSRIEGLRVRELPTKPGEFNRSSFVIEVKSNKIDIPSLALEDSVHRHAVIRVFREN